MDTRSTAYRAAPRAPRRLAALTVGLALAACSHGDRPGGTHLIDVGAVPELADVPDQPPQIQPVVAAVLDPAPTAPLGAGGGALDWTAAPQLTGVMVQAARDAAVIVLPVVAGARDYRVFALDGGATVASRGGRQHVGQGDIFCAGDRQFNDAAPAVPQVMQQVEVFGLAGPTRLVVEALDGRCPFTGVSGATAFADQVTAQEVPAADRVAIGVRPEAAIRADYDGAMIFNGHAPGTTLGAAAVGVDPHVLARTTIVVTPSGNGAPELAFFEDFSDSQDQPTFVSELHAYSSANASGGLRNSNGRLWQTRRFNVYQYNFADADLWVHRGQLQTGLFDRYQDTFATQYLVPRRPLQLADDSYLHVTYTVNSDATQRRYWWLFLCGSQAAGATLDGRGALAGDIVNVPFFYQPDAANPSLAHWNCLHLFPRDGTPFGLPPSGQRPQSDLRLMVNRAGVDPSVVDVSPDQYAATGQQGVASTVYPGWYRQQDGHGTMTGPILDDQMVIAPRTRYDVYVSRSRVILLVNGAQRLCNDLGAQRLTMAEAALGLGQVLYHSTAERLEFSDSFDSRTGQAYYLANTPYADVRSWDNIGTMERTAAPPNFDAGACFTYRGP